MAFRKNQLPCRPVFDESKLAGVNAAAWYLRCAMDVWMLCTYIRVVVHHASRDTHLLVRLWETTLHQVVSQDSAQRCH